MLTITKFDRPRRSQFYLGSMFYKLATLGNVKVYTEYRWIAQKLLTAINDGRASCSGS